MSLNCNITLSTHGASAGQTPPPMATLTVYNPNASAVAVTGIALRFYTPEGDPLTLPINPPMPAMGPGQTVVVPTLSSITFGPFPIVVGSAANANSFLSQPVPASGSGVVSTPVPRSAAHQPFTQIFVGGVVYGSDGSVNEAGRDGFLLGFTTLPPLYTQGGVSAFQMAGNANLIAAMVG